METKLRKESEEDDKERAHPAGASVLSLTNAYIFPGFIDAHNHVAYNFLPKWTPPKLYKNRGQWQGAQSYKDFKKPYDNM